MQDCQNLKIVRQNHLKHFLKVVKTEDHTVLASTPKRRLKESNIETYLTKKKHDLLRKWWFR